MKIRPTTILGLTLLLVGLALYGMGKWVLSKPAQYQATATIMVKVVVHGGSGGFRPADCELDPKLLKAAYKLFRSPTILSNVVATLNLNEIWGKRYSCGRTLNSTETMDMMKGRMHLAHRRFSCLVDLTFYSDDRKESALVANAIAKAYCDYRISSEQGLESKKILEMMQQQLQDEERQLQQVQTQVDLLSSPLNNGIFSKNCRWNEYSGL